VSRTRLNRGRGVDVLDLGIGESKDGFEVAVVLIAVDAARELNVLLRHRPRSISWRGVSRRNPGPTPELEWEIQENVEPRRSRSLSLDYLRSQSIGLALGYRSLSLSSQTVSSLRDELVKEGLPGVR
jgi:hypothetical protein